MAKVKEPNFNWVQHTEILKFALQYAENHKGDIPVSEACRNIIDSAVEEFGQHKCLGLTVNRLMFKIRSVVEKYKKDETYQPKDFWRQGACILNLQESPFKIKLNTTQPVTTVAEVVERPDPNRSRDGSNREDSEDNQQADSESELEEPSSDDSEYVEEVRDTIRKPVHHTHTIDLSKQKYSAPGVLSPEQIGRKRSQMNTMLSETVKGSSHRRQLPAQPGPTSRHQQNQEQSQDKESNGRSRKRPLDQTLVDDSTEEEDHILSTATDAKSFRPPAYSVKTIKLNHREAATQKTSTESGQAESSSRDEPSEKRQHTAHSRERVSTTLSTPACAYDPCKILDTMTKLGDCIHRTVEAELRARRIDGKRAYLFDDKLFDEASMRIVNKIFSGPTYTINANHLKRLIIESQASRRLTLKIFLNAFIGASVTMNALEPLPKCQSSNTSAEHDLYIQLLEFIHVEAAQRSGSTGQGQSYAISAHRFAMAKHIKDHVKPKIEEKATSLAHELRSQLLVLMIPEVTSSWSTLPQSLKPSGSAAISSFDTPTTADYPTTLDVPEMPVEDDLFERLRDIFRSALTARADWEIAGEAQYDMHFPEFRSKFHFDAHQCNEDVDAEKPHKIFVSLLPGVWSTGRDDRNVALETRRCITKSLVYLIDP